MKRILFISVLVFIAITGFSQKISLRAGNLDALKGQKEFEVQFTYNNIMIGNMTEAEYVEKRKIEINEKEGDGGERWHRAWLGDRSEKFEYKFMLLFNKYAEPTGISIDEKAPEAKYIMIVNTHFTEPGFNVGVHSRPAFVSLTIEFVERANPSNIVAKYELAKAPGAATFDAGTRIQEGYAKAGKSFGALMAKQLK
jgi:hypothetical protein